MADVQPLKTLRYDPDVAGPLEDLIAPPYDVIDDEARAELARRSAHNVVELDLPTSYEAAAETLDEWRRDGVLVQEDEPAIWALRQDYTAPDGSTRSRRGFFARVRVEDYGAGRIRPHERTHPGPKEDRLRLTRATRANHGCRSAGASSPSSMTAIPRTESGAKSRMASSMHRLSAP